MDYSQQVAEEYILNISSHVKSSMASLNALASLEHLDGSPQFIEAFLQNEYWFVEVLMTFYIERFHPQPQPPFSDKHSRPTPLPNVSKRNIYSSHEQRILSYLELYILQNMSEKTMFRVTVFFKKKPGLTDEEFSHHWQKIHGPLVAPWALKHGINQYTQIHTPAALRSKISGDNVPSGNGILDYDGGVDWYVESYEAYENAYKDPYYINVIEPDEHNFVDKGTGGQTAIVGAVSTLGVCKNIVLNGRSMVKSVELSEDQKKYL